MNERINECSYLLHVRIVHCAMYVSGVMASAQKKKQLVAKWINILEGNYEFSFSR